MKAKTEPWMLILMIVVGAIIGSLLWSLVTPYLPEIFAKSVSVGTTNAPLNVDLDVVNFTFGIVLEANIGSMLGMIAAFIIYRKM